MSVAIQPFTTLSLTKPGGEKKSPEEIAQELISSVDGALDGAVKQVGDDRGKASELAQTLRQRTGDYARSMLNDPAARPDPHNGMTVFNFLSLGMSVGAAYGTSALAARFGVSPTADPNLPPMTLPSTIPADPVEQICMETFLMADRMVLATQAQLAKGNSAESMKAITARQLQEYAKLPGMGERQGDPPDLAAKLFTAASFGAQVGAAYAVAARLRVTA